MRERMETEIKRSTFNSQHPTLKAERMLKLSVGRSALGVGRFSQFDEFERQQRSLNRCARLDRESGFERTDAGAFCGDSASGNFCGCAVRVLERGTKFARRIVLVRSGIGSRSLRRPEFYQRRLFHADGGPARASAEWPDHKTFQRSNLEILRPCWKSSDDDRTASAASSGNRAGCSRERSHPVDRRSWDRFE